MSKNEKPYCLIDAKDLRRILPFKAVQDVRYYLNGVRVEPSGHEGCTLVATNGHMLAALDSPMSTATEPFILETGHRFCRALRDRGMSDGKVRAQTKDSHVEILSRCGSFVEWVQPGKAFIDGRYPDWRKILPEEQEVPPGIVGGFNPKYLERAFRAFARHVAGNEHEAACRLYQKDAESPLIMRGRGLVVMLMPLRRIDDLSPAIPDWVTS